MAHSRRNNVLNPWPLFIAMISWGVGWVLAEIFQVRTWSNLAMLGLNDFFFFWLISSIRIVKINYIKRRYMCSILALSLMYIIPFSIVTYVFEYSSYDFIVPIQSVMISSFATVSLVLSLLLIGISITPQVILNGINSRCWPDSASVLLDYRLQEDNADSEEGTHR